MISKRYVSFFLAVVIVLFVTIAAAQDNELPACTISISELESDVQSHLSLRNDRVEDLQGLMENIVDTSISRDSILDLMYWVVMADSAMFRSQDIEYPDCEEYQSLDQTYRDLLADVYAVSTQTMTLSEVELNDFQQGNVADLLRDRLQALAINYEIWRFVYVEIED